MKTILLIATLFCLFFAGCGENGAGDGNSTNYTATITANAAMNNGEKNDITIAVTPTPQGNDVISSVELFINGKPHQTLFNSPYKFDYTPKDVLPGTYKLNAVIKFQDGKQVAVEKDINVKVKLDTEFQGGVIISLNADGLHGIISAKTDLQGGVLGRYRYGNPGVDYQAYSETDGWANTQGFVGKNDNNFAATACLNYNDGGYGDWYLPSVKEFDLIEEFESDILTPIKISSIYWTSTQREDRMHAEVGWNGRVSYILKDLEVGVLYRARCYRKF